jgi:hypothetical protein
MYLDNHIEARVVVEESNLASKMVKRLRENLLGKNHCDFEWIDTITMNTSET